MSEKLILKLYIIASSPACDEALRNIKEIISRQSENIFKLKVIDVSKHPQLAEDDKILAVPTLMKKLPPPLRKIIGDLSDKQKVLLGLDLKPLNKKKVKRET